MDQKKSNLANIWLISVVVIIVLLLVICTGYYLWANEKNQTIAPININTEEDLSAAASAEAEVISEDFLAYFKVRNEDDVEIYRVDKDGETNLIKTYNEDLGDRVALTYLLNNPDIYISGLGENEYTVIDSSGSDISSEYPYFKKKNFDVTNYVKVPGYERLVYSLGPGQDQLEGKPLIVSAYDHSTIDYIETEEIPNTIISNRPFAWSNDEQDLYVTKVGWECFDHADLWKVRFDSKEVTHLDQADQLALGELSVNPDQDLAVGIEMAEVPCTECMCGTRGGAPSAIYSFNLADNTYQEVLVSEDRLLYNIALSPDGQKIFYLESISEFGASGDLYMANIDGSDEQKIAEDTLLQAMSEDGSIIIIGTNNYTLMNLSDDTEVSLTADSLTDDSVTSFINCNYPLGFSCLYE